MKIHNTQPNSRSILCGYRDEMVNRLINKSSELEQKEYKTRKDWVGKVIH